MCGRCKAECSSWVCTSTLAPCSSYLPEHVPVDPDGCIQQKRWQEDVEEQLPGGYAKPYGQGIAQGTQVDRPCKTHQGGT